MRFEIPAFLFLLSSTVVFSQVSEIGKIQKPSSSNPEGFTASETKLFFSASTPEVGRELWSTNGTEAGTQLVKDTYGGPLNGMISSKKKHHPVIFDGLLFFIGTDALSMNSLSSGIYMVEIITGSQRYIKKVIKK